MFAGKTSALLRAARRHVIQNRNVVYISGDQRYDANHIVTHDMYKVPAKCFATLNDAKPLARQADVVVVDEGQFFPDLAQVAEEWANQGKIVLISTLTSDYRREGFPNVDALLPKVEHLHPLTAICIACQKEAHFTHRVGTLPDKKAI